MSDDAKKGRFATRMKSLRAGGERPEPAEIARLAREAGLSIPEIFAEVQKFVERHPRPPPEISTALSLFVAAVCGADKSRSVLEYTAELVPLTATLTERGDSRELAYIAPDLEVERTMKQAFHGRAASILHQVDDLPMAARFSTIVCRPPLGFRPLGVKDADGFGGEIVRLLANRLTVDGILLWVTGQGVLWNQQAKKTLGALGSLGLGTRAVVDVAPGGLPGTTIAGLILAFSRDGSDQKLLGALRDPDAAEGMAHALRAGPAKRNVGPWTWVLQDDPRTFANLEQERLVQKLMPRGRFDWVSLGDLLIDRQIQKADRPLRDEDQAASHLFVPEYAGGCVTPDLEEQTVKQQAVYRLSIDPTRANTRFLAQLLNSPYGMALKATVARGVTIQRISAKDLLFLELPIPSVSVQDRIVAMSSDMGIISAALSEMDDALWRDWSSLPEMVSKIDKTKAVFDIERLIADWWTELPYPLATIYRGYQVSTEPKERLGALLHFFEMAAVYLATIGVSHVKALRLDWHEVLGKWLHPPRAAGIERADFGFWIGLAGASLKETRRIGSDKKLRQDAIEIAGPELVDIAGTLAQFSGTLDILHTARTYRNNWIGHGGHIKETDAAMLDRHLQQSMRGLYEICAPLFRRFHLVRPGLAYGTDTGMNFEVERLSGSDPTFNKMQIELDGRVKTNELAFWMEGARSVCRAVHFFRLGPPQEPEEKSIYVFNRVENEGFRWISYQAAREQEFIAPDEDLLGIISLGRQER